jgi:hypothetical protein
MPLVLGRLPQDRDELWLYLKVVWGMTIPRHSVCPNHSNPFEALAQAYFGEVPVSIWKGSRGFGGKSTLMGTLCAIEAATLGAQITVLGGSASQSQRVHDVARERFEYEAAPAGLIKGDPTMFQTKLKNGAWILALLASQKSVRGPHPNRLRIDEADEVEIDLIEAAQGQPMSGRGMKAQTVFSSTHQYPDGTMTELIRRANEKDWPVHEWCWRENIGTPEEPGWLTMEEVERKKQEVSARMFAVEYDLQEPSFDGRAIDAEFVEAMFDQANYGWFEGAKDEYITLEEPVEGATYVTGVDWAKENDWTIMRTYRTDVDPWVEVAFLRTGRKPWPEMVADLDDVLFKYGGICVHDATGLGGVVDDLITYPKKSVKPVVLRGRERESIFTQYIAGIEQNGMVGPRIQFAYNEHKYCTHKDLYGSGHPPDSFIAGALAWSIRLKRHRIDVRPGLLTRETSPWRPDGGTERIVRTAI